MNGEFVKTADYQLHAGKLNTARRHPQDLPKLFLLSIVSPVPAKLTAIATDKPG